MPVTLCAFLKKYPAWTTLEYTSSLQIACSKMFTVNPIFNIFAKSKEVDAEGTLESECENRFVIARTVVEIY